jgi:hypothetical protein
MLVSLAISDLSARKDSKIASSTSYLGGADFLTTLGLLDLKCVARISTDAADCMAICKQLEYGKTDINEEQDDV